MVFYSRLFCLKNYFVNISLELLIKFVITTHLFKSKDLLIFTYVDSYISTYNFVNSGSLWNFLNVLKYNQRKSEWITNHSFRQRQIGAGRARWSMKHFHIYANEESNFTEVKWRCWCCWGSAEPINFHFFFFYFLTFCSIETVTRSSPAGRN